MTYVNYWKKYIIIFYCNFLQCVLCWTIVIKYNFHWKLFHKTKTSYKRVTPRYYTIPLRSMMRNIRSGKSWKSQDILFFKIIYHIVNVRTTDTAKVVGITDTVKIRISIGALESRIIVPQPPPPFPSPHPRLLIFWIFSTQDIFIPTPPSINFQSFLLTFLSVHSIKKRIKKTESDVVEESERGEADSQESDEERNLFDTLCN